MNDALQIVQLTKAFGNKVAVNNLSLGVPQGSMFGLVGPNGAGKTTTLSMVTGLLRPDSGHAFVLGHDVWADPFAAKALMGVSPDGVRLFDRLSARELLRYCGLLRGMQAADIESRSHGLLDALGLAGDANKLVADFSAGMTKKISLACALLHAPRIVLLDEPFEAVDPVSGQAIRGILSDYVRGGGTVIMSSHVMELVETLCDHVAVVNNGQVLASGTTQEVKGGISLQERFLSMIGVRQTEGLEEMSWLRTS
ncbi:MAG: ABC transporter ATP-binding protein [Propionibacteriaceae bacterium]